VTLLHKPSRVSNGKVLGHFFWNPLLLQVDLWFKNIKQFADAKGTVTLYTIPEAILKVNREFLGKRYEACTQNFHIFVRIPSLKNVPV